jgi:hypothetical protein
MVRAHKELVNNNTKLESERAAAMKTFSKLMLTHETGVTWAQDRWNWRQDPEDSLRWTALPIGLSLTQLSLHEIL